MIIYISIIINTDKHERPLISSNSCRELGKREAVHGRKRQQGMLR